MPDFIEGTGEVADNLKIVHIRGDKVMYDSEKDASKVKSKMVLPDKPKTFCADCGGTLQAVIFQCKCCHSRFVQSQEMTPYYNEVEKKIMFKPGRIMVFALPAEENIEKTKPEEVAEAAQTVQSQDPQRTPST
jgi:hypothetical protein